MHIPSEKRKKLDRRSSKCIFVGYPQGKKGYKLYELSSGKMMVSRDVIFVENVFDHSVDKGDEPSELLPATFFENFGLKEDKIDQDGDTTDNNVNEESIVEHGDDLAVEGQSNDDDHSDGTEEEPQVPTQRPQRTKRTPDYYGEVVSHRYGVWEENDANMARVDDPKTFREATTCSNSGN